MNEIQLYYISHLVNVTRPTATSPPFANPLPLPHEIVKHQMRTLKYCQN